MKDSVNKIKIEYRKDSKNVYHFWVPNLGIAHVAKDKRHGLRQVKRMIEWALVDNGSFDEKLAL